ncbi:unnamed protein product [Adineta steineri]|uniref:lytic cellulose monooxygenase (C4-dehydrogenating) n=2 Tax=Adineta steineri TaxID=433720 RepID=A0A815JC58_9BILA|nr:unnamed protein product [Adineta steineri]CAF3978172.1 unnamed protein product [Adineta steineri]
MDVNDINFRCYSSGRTAPHTYTVEAGSEITFHSNNQLYHIGVANVYMAKAPGKVVDFDGSGNVWFKVFEIPAYPDPAGHQYPTFPSSGSHILYSNYCCDLFQFVRILETPIK